MQFEPYEIVELNDFLSPHDNNVVLKYLFDTRELWEARRDRAPSYKNGEWYTFGASMYLDLQKESDWENYCRKVEYFNSVLNQHFRNFYKMLLLKLTEKTGGKFEMAEYFYPHFGYPGFHIFPPHLSLTEFFGRKHQDLQWKAFEKMPDFPKTEVTDHFSGTYCIKIPPLGPHFIYDEKLDTKLTYNERALYLHSGQFDHAIAPLKNPVTQFDWRITLQFHGFRANGVNYIYW
jgi:hypothetical protein